MSDWGLEKSHLLHCCVGCTADVPGYDHQVARVDACHHLSQIALEPQLKVFRGKVYKFRSKGCQGQVQDGVSYGRISEDGDVSLEIKRIPFQFREVIVEMRASL